MPPPQLLSQHGLSCRIAAVKLDYVFCQIDPTVVTCIADPRFLCCRCTQDETDHLRASFGGAASPGLLAWLKPVFGTATVAKDGTFVEIDWLQPLAGKQVLDVGCGKGDDSREIARLVTNRRATI